LPIKDETAAHPIAAEWRAAFAGIVHAFVEGDYRLSRSIPCVREVPAETASQIRAYIADYGATLVDLPEETWRTSCAQWMGTHWDVLLDLWTTEEGGSDMALAASVFETDQGFEVEVYSVHVP
jgi:hypothetical protein